MQLVFLSKPARSFMGNKDQVGVFHLKGWLKVKSGGRYQEGRGMYKSSATRSADETREVIEGLAKNRVLVTFTTDAQSFNTLLDSTIPSELKNYVQDIVRDGHRAPSDQRVKEVGGASGQRPEEVQAAA